MCTVTYLPLGCNNFILTSNRDETPLRNTIKPKKYIENGVGLTYPKDELSGGTWIGLSDKKRLVCLLNGGFKNHKKKSSYRMSRGVVVKKILASEDGVALINNFDFLGIEPFTIILVDWSIELVTYELVWDGLKKYFQKLPQEPKIWSSSTLYTNKMKQLRKNWFLNWLAQNKKFYQKEILKFHKNDTIGTQDVSLKMKRSLVETVSTTSVIKEDSNIAISYIDFLEKSETNQQYS
ncbi:MAG: NRDE family protein [Polaribacter sp.]|uniref:NRDE family protein n=1 Tax=Polaribacter sp. TaxID=1920175 RepID=UPI003264895C